MYPYPLNRPGIRRVSSSVHKQPCRAWSEKQAPWRHKSQKWSFSPFLAQAPCGGYEGAWASSPLFEEAMGSLCRVRFAPFPKLGKGINEGESLCALYFLNWAIGVHLEIGGLWPGGLGKGSGAKFY